MLLEVGRSDCRMNTDGNTEACKGEGYGYVTRCKSQASVTLHTPAPATRESFLGWKSNCGLGCASQQKD